jgi:ureidoacrylate peracid hydrolase
MTRTDAALPAELVAIATRRRAGLAAFETIAPPRTALLAINMQNAWLAADAPFDTGGTALAILPNVNRLAAAVRARGGAVFWLRMTTGRPGTPLYWSTYFDNFIGADKRGPAVAALQDGAPLHALHQAADRRPGDVVLPKYRFSAFAGNPHDLDATLRERGIDTVIVAGAATNICCESTVRDAMMRDFRCFMPHDAVAAPQPDAHLAGLRSVMQVFADVRPTADLLHLMEGQNG